MSISQAILIKEIKLIKLNIYIFIINLKYEKNLNWFILAKN